MDIAAWLQDLDLKRYVSAFRDNDIDGEVLPKLTAEGWKGLTSLCCGPANRCDGPTFQPVGDQDRACGRSPRRNCPLQKEP